jgi:hypothetical protein
VCGNKYKARSLYGTGNLRKHIQGCAGANTHNVGQMLLAGKSRSLSIIESKFDPKRYRKLLVASIIKHDLPFSYVEYDGVRETHQYLCVDVPFISRNIVKVNLVKMHLREKEMVKSRGNYLLPP